MKPSEIRPIATTKSKLAESCMSCAAKATVEALFHLNDAILVRKYCAVCLATAEY